MSATFITLENLWLSVPFEDKDEAKARGARWERKKEIRLWYAPPGQDPLHFRKWWSFLLSAAEYSSK
mgnify:CR=1 FL=1